MNRRNWRRCIPLSGEESIQPDSHRLPFRNCHGKKFDKETQSPLLKIFKEIMTRERDDPEKRNLLMEQKEDKKRRQYSGSRSKTDRRCDSSCSEHRKRGTQYKSSSTEQRVEHHKKPRSQTPFPPEKKDSWWFWQKDQNTKNQTEDTCSCVSCALKRIVSSEYACIGCLLLLFTISIVVAFLVVFKSVPACSASTDRTEVKDVPKPKMADSERLKRKIEMLSENRMKNDFAGLDDYRKLNKRRYDDPFLGHIGFPGDFGIDFGPSFRELNSLQESENKLSEDTDWSNVLDMEKTSESQSSDKLREFYKKLVQTDAKIKSLKKINQGSGFLDNGNDEAILKSPDRSKRSLKLFNYPKKYHVIRQRRSVYNKDRKASEGTLIRKRHGNRTRLKRYGGELDDPTGFVIEKKKLIIQYKPAGTKKKLQVKKCSHAPKDLNVHESQLKHPFYKNTQRLDELLDRFLNKNLPEIMSDPFGIDMLFNHDKNSKCKHPLPHKNVDIVGKEKLVDQIPKPNCKIKKVKEEKMIETATDIMKLLRPETSTQYESDFFHHEAQMIGKEKLKVVTASPNDFEVLLSVSTIMNPDLKKVGRLPTVSFLDKVPNLRRLMQLEGEEDENLGYEDFKEVLTDDMENNDDMDKGGDRRKRQEKGWKDPEQPQPVPTEKCMKYNPPGVHNPNWKGPMPLYPDELSSMFRHSAMNANKVEYPTSTKDIQAGFFEKKGKGLSDIEYVEDYLSNKYDRLVEMAQAYSDYGVLDDKKDNRNDKNTASDPTQTEHRVKLTADRRFNRAGLLGRKQGSPPGLGTQTTEEYKVQLKTEPFDLEDTIGNSIISNNTEGIRFEIRPTSKARDDELGVFGLLKQHVSIKPPSLQTNTLKENDVHSTLISSYPDMELIYSPKEKTKAAVKFEQCKKLFKSSGDADRENRLIFSLSKGKRNLLSTDYKTTIDIRVDADTTVDKEKSTEKHDETIDEFVKNFNIRKYNASKEEALARYIEKVKQNNIRIYSTIQPDLSHLTPLVKVPPMPTTDALYNKYGDAKSKLNDTVVTINTSEIRLDDYSGNNRFEGKILLTVENPDFGTEHINLRFDVPLVININDEVMTMGDSFTVGHNYSYYETSTLHFMEHNENDTDLDMDHDHHDFKKSTKRKRGKRDANLLKDPYQANMTEFPAIGPSNVTINSSIKNDSSINSNTSLIFNVSAKNTRYKNNSDTDMTLSDFFMMISDWFKALEGVKVDKPRESPGSDLTKMLLKFNDTSEIKNTTDTAYPLYDSDMIENIGHRSRVLLSIDNLANITDEMKEMGNANATRVKRADGSGGNATKATNSSTPLSNLNSNKTTSDKDGDTIAKVAKRDNNKKGKAIFKRNADDSNLIFWNDIYDDEYGIQNDKLDNSIRDKHSVEENDFIKRSGRWVHDKIRKFAENLKINPRAGDMDVGIKERATRSAMNPGFATYPKYIYESLSNRLGRREADDKEEDYDVEQKSIFTALTANMADVCRKASRAVQHTRNIEVREDSKQNTIAASLMQQLVRLLTDLVDYQVQQKTCTKLPADLQSFLEWLTYPKDETPETQTETFTYKTPYQEEDLMEELEVQDEEDRSTDRLQDAMSMTQLPIERTATTTDVRMHYLECLNSIQDLLEHYEAMSDDEKSKMTGVKNYLESQMRYLNKQLSGYDLFTLFEKHNQMRYKRDIRNRRLRTLKHKPVRRINKFVKNFGKKHTRTTASFDDAVRVTDMKRKTDKADDSEESKSDQALDKKISNDVKRNLKDVYYKAIAEAKKYATAKNLHNKDEVTAFASTTAKVQTRYFASFTP